MLPYIVIIAAVLITAVALRLFAGPDEPDNAIVHTSGDAEDEQDPGDLAIARRIAA